jgi:hypothetical protein
MGRVTYRVQDETGIYEVEVRREVSDDERNIYNGTAEEIERDLVGAIGLIRRSYNSSLPIPPATVAAFNAWQTAEHACLIAEIERRQAKYGEVLLADDPARVPPPPVRGAHYEIGRGWVCAGDEVTDDPGTVGRIGIGGAGDQAGDA